MARIHHRPGAHYGVPSPLLRICGHVLRTSRIASEKLSHRVRKGNVQGNVPRTRKRCHPIVAKRRSGATRAFTATGADRIAWTAPDPRESPLSTAKNHFGFQGLTVDDESGLLYVRNRYLEPDTGRFLTDDANLFMDSGNAGQFALHAPLDFSDPEGLEVLGCANARCWSCGSYTVHDRFGAPSDFSFVERAGDRMVVFVHGYNVGADSAETWSWKVDRGFKVAGREQPIFGFSWPGDPAGEGWSTPLFALAERNADCAGVALARLLGDIRKRGGHGQDLFLMTHSLGARVGLRALSKIAAMQKAPLVSPGYEIGVDGIFMFNAAVPEDALSPAGEFVGSLEATRYVGNYYSAADEVLWAFRLNQLIVPYTWSDVLLRSLIPFRHTAMGSGVLWNRVAAQYQGKIIDRNMLDSRVSGKPAITHSKHLDTATWQDATPARLYLTLARDFNMAKRASRER